MANFDFWSMRLVILLCALSSLKVRSESADDGEPKVSSHNNRPNLSISDRVLPIQLVDSVDASVRVPRRKQLKLSVLMNILGDDFNPTWMAIDKPGQMIQESTTPTESISDKLLLDVQRLNLSREIPNGEGDDWKAHNAMVERFEQWLLKKASCPVQYVWDDVGPLFWPQWIKRGECINVDGGQACSWPKGMHCVPAESSTIYLLRWHCRARNTTPSRLPKTKSKQKSPMKRLDHRQLRCQWLKVPYPVTSKCHCSC